MDTQKIIQSQYLAALWNAPGDQDKFWEHAKTSNWIGKACSLPDPKMKEFINEVTK